jgi:hypothetical protein
LENKSNGNDFWWLSNRILIDKGLIPFSYWSDWGLLCFDTNRNEGDYNYPIILWDHEIADEVQNRYKDFYDLLINLDKEEKKDIA